MSHFSFFVSGKENRFNYSWNHWPGNHRTSSFQISWHMFVRQKGNIPRPSRKMSGKWPEVSILLIQNYTKWPSLTMSLRNFRRHWKYFKSVVFSANFVLIITQPQKKKDSFFREIAHFFCFEENYITFSMSKRFWNMLVDFIQNEICISFKFLNH